MTKKDWKALCYDPLCEIHNPATLAAEAIRSIESMTRVQQQVNDQAREIQQLREQLAAAQAALGRATDATGISFDPNPLPNGRTK